ncbi:MAG: ribosome maturation factor RimP [Candidatus Zixiibacteriota bacterium]
MALKDKIKEILLPLVAEQNFELVDLEIKGKGPTTTLRVFVDKVGGITLDECTALSEKLSLSLDMEDLFPGRYTLEVSSPGLERPLVSEPDFKRKIGENVKIFLKIPVDNKSVVEGRIKDFKDQKLWLDSEGEEKVIAFERIEKAKIII